MIGLHKIIKLFEDGNVCVVGLRGRGKDMLMSNVVVRRKLPYVANIDYTDDYIPFELKNFDCGKNDYRNFINGTVKKYVFPYEDGTDLYLSDVGVYFPSQYCSELNRDYKYFPVYMGLSRQLGSANVHTNCQNLNRIWDKIREQSDTYIRCMFCKVIYGYVIQLVIEYDLYDSCVQRVKPFNITLPLMATREMKMNLDLERERYEQKYGKVKRHLLIYRNISSYDTREFKAKLEEGIENENH